MGQSDASPLRAHRRFALFSGLKPSGSIAGYARQLSHPAYERLVKSEAPLRRLVPVLIVIFLIILGTARWLALDKQYTNALESADRELVIERSESQSGPSWNPAAPRCARRVRLAPSYGSGVGRPVMTR